MAGVKWRVWAVMGWLSSRGDASSGSTRMARRLFVAVGWMWRCRGVVAVADRSGVVSRSGDGTHFVINTGVWFHDRCLWLKNRAERGW